MKYTGKTVVFLFVYVTIGVFIQIFIASGGIFMAEYKQYIKQEQENGSIMISEDVVSTIAERAILDVEGVAGLDAKPGSELADKITKMNWGRGLKVMIAEDNSVSIECVITILYGYSVVDVAAAAQTAAASAVESMAGVHVTGVQVNISGIIRK